MKVVFAIIFSLFLCKGFCQKDTFLLDPLPSTQTIQYKYYLQFDSIKDVNVEPYYAQFTGLANVGNIIHKKTGNIVEIKTQDHLDCLFEYASPHPELYGDGFLIISEFYFQQENIRKQYPPISALHCSKIINSKREEVYIYFVTITGPDELEQLNPFLAFEAICGLNPDRWYPREIVENNTTKITSYDLAKGTYFFNWWDAQDSLNQSLKALWRLVYHYESLIDSVGIHKDSLMNLYQSTGEKSYLTLANSTYVTPINQEYDQKRSQEFRRIIKLGYGDLHRYKENSIIQFEIRKEALLSHKISKKAVSPEQLSNYLSKPKKKRPKTVKKLLEIFVIN